MSLGLQACHLADVPANFTHPPTWQESRKMQLLKGVRVTWSTILAAVTATLLMTSCAAQAQDFNSPMSYRKMTSGGNCDTCFWIAADGIIERNSAGKLESFLGYDGRTPLPGIRIHLNSPGGDLMGGVRLGEAIREMQLNTAVSTSLTKEVWADGTHLAESGEDPESQCSSACVFAFVGGISRYVSEHTPPDEVGFRDLGKLGVHQFYDRAALIDPEALSRTGTDAIVDQFIVAHLLRHVDRMGVSAELLQLASETLPTDMHYLTEEELTRTRADSWSVREIFVRGYKNGVAIIELQYARKNADYRLELYCDNGSMKMLASIRWRGNYDIEAHRSWSVLEGLKLEHPSGDTEIRIRKLSEEFTRTPQGNVEGKFWFVFDGAPLSELVGLNTFSFSDWSSRHANDAAKEFSFTLPSDFGALYLLPNACLRG
jgi:hypothetical protein